MNESARGRVALATVALVVVVVASSSRHRVSLPLERSAVGRYLGDVGAIVFGATGLLAVALLVTMTALIARRKRRNPEGELVEDRPHGRWVRLGAWLIVLAMFVLPASLVIAARHRSASQSPLAPLAPPPTISGRPEVSAVPNATPIAVAALVAAVLVAAALALWAWRRSRNAGAEAAEPSGSSTTTPDDAATAATMSAVTALHDFRDPRQAILASYAAMRAALLRAGVPARAADTPTEFLLRVTTSGAAPSARQLTALFHEARFSEHPMTSTHRRQAEAALHQIASSLVNDADDNDASLP
jgi:hypothetical protein